MLAGTLASAAMSQPVLEEEPGVMRRLQGVLLDHDDVKFFKKTAKAGEAVKDAIGTKVSSSWHCCY
jgi:hypothetical protein